ncbi:MAG: carbohydrate-binding domain-containing protein [Dehalococcoidia bacterium]|jgi:hypothetical protein
MKRITTVLLVLTLVLALIPGLIACSDGNAGSGDNASAPQYANGDGNEIQDSVVNYSDVSVEYDNDDEYSRWDSVSTSAISLKGDSIKLVGGGAMVIGTSITIISAGTYSLSGILDDGQIIVDTEDKATVRLVLNGADISCSTSAPIYVVDAAKVVITLADGTENYIRDGDTYILEDAESDEPNAAIFSKDDLTINGNGSLTVEANYNNGIQSKDELKIISGNITVNAANDGIKGRDCLAIKDGNITVDAGGDGMQSNNDEDAAKGLVFIEGGMINITAGEDGIQAETGLIVSDGDIKITTGDGSTASGYSPTIGDGFRRDMGRERWDTEDTPDNGNSNTSAKGLKAGAYLEITSGTINIDSADDSLHSNNILTISGGDIVLASGDDGIHSDLTLEVNGADINITKCYEGIESAAITINDGNIHIVSSDDAINVSGAAGGGQTMRPPGQTDFNLSGNNHLCINGGYTVIQAIGDGLDINGSITMTGGVVIINGPSSPMNGAVDYYNGFQVSGGFIIAVGSSFMAQAPDMSSTQYSVLLFLSSVQPAGTTLHIETENGEEVLTFVPTTAYQSVVFCSPELEEGTSYIVYTGGSSTGTVSDGLYSGGEYSGGDQIASFVISNTVTIVGSLFGDGFGDGDGFPNGGGMPPGDWRR